MQSTQMASKDATPTATVHRVQRVCLGNVSSVVFIGGGGGPITSENIV